MSDAVFIMWPSFPFTPDRKSRSMNDSIRSLVKIVEINDILPAHNADRLELAVIGGWHVVVPKGQYAKGDRVIFAEIDSAIPVDDERFNISDGMKSQAKTIDGTRRLIISTSRFRGNLSQGIIFSLDNFPEFADVDNGLDISDVLGITKWEEEITLAGIIIGNFDDKLAQRSDAERIQNLTEFFQEIQAEPWIATEKLDGSSVTIANDDGRIRLFSRTREQDPADNPIFTVFSEEELLREIPVGWAIQGEMVGPKIQGNKLKLSDHRIFIFGVFKNGQPVEHSTWSNWMLKHSVPVLDIAVGTDVEALISAVNGLKSTINPKVMAEGVVFHHAHATALPGIGRPAFKVINNKFLLKRR